MRRSVGLLAAMVGTFCGLTVGGAADLTLQKGQEIVYNGAVKFAFQSSNQSAAMKFAMRERRLVTETSGAGSQVTVFQEFAPEPADGRPVEVSLRTAELEADGTEKSSTPSKFQPDAPEYLPSPMPLVFPRELKAGDQWEGQEKIGFLALPPHGFQVAYRVSGEENVGDAACWKVEKKIAEFLPTTRSLSNGSAEVTYESFVERFWVGKSQPLLMRWERAVQVTYVQGRASARYDHSWDIVLQSQQTLPATELAAREEQLKALRSIEDKLTLAGSKDAATAAKAFKSKYPRSPYLSVLSLATDIADDLKKQTTRPKTGPFSVTLSELSTGKWMSLWDLRGKIIVLNFFASW